MCFYIAATTAANLFVRSRRHRDNSYSWFREHLFPKSWTLSVVSVWKKQTETCRVYHKVYVKNKNELSTDSVFSVFPQVLGPAARQLLVPGDGFKRAESGRKCDVSRPITTINPTSVCETWRETAAHKPTLWSNDGCRCSYNPQSAPLFGPPCYNTHHHWGGTQLSWKQSGDEVLV